MSEFLLGSAPPLPQRVDVTCNQFRTSPSDPRSEQINNLAIARSSYSLPRMVFYSANQTTRPLYVSTSVSPALFSPDASPISQPISASQTSRPAPNPSFPSSRHFNCLWPEEKSKSPRQARRENLACPVEIFVSQSHLNNADVKKSLGRVPVEASHCYGYPNHLSHSS